jgi:FkbM family methyltransferase
LHYSLVVIGAHDGSKTEGLVQQSIGQGSVLLVEPVPFLFARLRSRYDGQANVILRNIVVSPRGGDVDFTAPKETANTAIGYGDQLGSMIADHAVHHDAGMAAHVETIRLRSESFETLIDSAAMSSIDILLTDTEGMDAELLPTFPFAKIRPRHIIFEFKHADGTHRVGRQLAALLVLLDDLGYAVRVLDVENLIATHGSVAATATF